MVVAEGMPIYRTPFEKGRLIIQFSINFPDTIPEDQIKKLEKFLPGREECIVTDDMEEVSLVSYTLEHEAQSHHRNAYDDDEDHPGHRGMQCQTH